MNTIPLPPRLLGSRDGSIYQVWRRLWCPSAHAITIHHSSSLHAVYYWTVSDFPAAASQSRVLPIPHLYFSSSLASGGMFPRNLWCLSLTSSDCFEYKIYFSRKYHDLISLLGYLVVLSFNFSDYKHCWAVIGYWMSSILNCWIRIYAYFKLQWAMKVLL